MATDAAFEPERVHARLAGRGATLGQPLTFLAETTSTNDLALAAARSGAPHGATWVAGSQTAGRGRRGRAWTSPPGESLLFSVLLRPTLPPEQMSQMALVAGLAVRASAATRTDERLKVKWPNDVVAGRKKLAGILVESRLDGARVEALVVGIGVNVHTRVIPEEIATVATSLSLLGDPAPSRELVLADILAELEMRLGWLQTGQHARLLEELRAEDALLGERVAVGELRGAGAGIDDAGALLVRDDAGVVHAVSSGTVERG